MQQNRTGKAITVNQYMGFSLLPNSTTRVNIGCNFSRNLTLENLSLNKPNFDIVSIWPSLPQNLSRDCNLYIAIKLKASNTPTTENLSIIELVKQK